AHLLGVGLGQRPAEDREVLGEDEDRARFDGPVAGDHPVAGALLLVHAEIERAMDDELVQLLEGPRVEQEGDPLTGGEPAVGLLAGAALFAPSRLRFAIAAAQLLERIPAQWDG